MPQALAITADPGRVLADEDDGGRRVLRLGGRLTVANIGAIDRRLAALKPERRALVLDLAAAGRIDTTGAWVIYRTLRDWRAGGGTATVAGATGQMTELIEALAETDRPVRVRGHHDHSFRGRVGSVGRSLIGAVATLGGFLAFLGTTLVTLMRVLPQPGRWRWNPVIYQAEQVMVHALGIVGLMAFLVGLVIAQQGAVQLAQFGAEVFTINLIGRATLRELGVLMTAIMVAGRSGAAFAAQLGSMKLAEEIDAMRTIGMSPYEALVLPRVIALVLTMPLLAFFAAICALIGGGLFVYVDIGIPPQQFIRRIQEVVPMTDFYITLIKAPLFGMVIAVTGCYQGMQVTGNAESVGQRTTSAVVQSIFLVIVLDAFLAVFFTALGWI